MFYCITSAKAWRYLIHGRSWQWVWFYVVFALPVGQIVAAVENSATKVLHAIKFKFHHHESSTREAKHFLNVQRLGTLWHVVCTLMLQTAVKISSRRSFMKNYFIRGSVLALTLGVAGMGSLYAQDSKPAQTDPQASQPSQSQPAPGAAQSAPTSAQSSKEFTGMIVKEKGAMMLKDSSSNVSYKVDDDSKVKDYEGKQVKVTGTLDSSTNVIHVDSIQGIS
jgi:uncharacterized protein DUF5818